MFRDPVFSRTECTFLILLVLAGFFAGSIPAYSESVSAQASAQVPAYQAYPVPGGCLYITAQGYAVMREANTGAVPSKEFCR